MKHLFIARHGNYGGDNLISSGGIAQIEALGKQIKEILNGGSASIVSSTAPRALGSSYVLSNILTGQDRFFQEPYLWSGADSPKDTYYHDLNNDKLLDIVNKYRNKADGLIIMSHLEVGERFPEYFFRKEFQKSVKIKEIDKGEAVYINLEKQEYKMLRRF